MSRSLMSRFATPQLVRRACVPASQTTTRAFTQTARRYDDDSNASKVKSRNLLQNLYGTPEAPKSQPAEENSMASLSQSSVFKAMSTSGIDLSVLSGNSTSTSAKQNEKELNPYHFHVYSTKHNTHITCSKPNREPIISLSAGNLGYKKARRGTFDSAYSLTKYVLERLVHNGWPVKINRLEVVLRGFGQGREAAVKVLMSPEGKILRDKIVRVADSTRIKFGGTRSPRPRRL